MRFGGQLCALAFSAMLSISIMVIADEEVEEIVDGRGHSYSSKA